MNSTDLPRGIQAHELTCYLHGSQEDTQGQLFSKERGPGHGHCWGPYDPSSPLHTVQSGLEVCPRPDATDCMRLPGSVVGEPTAYGICTVVSFTRTGSAAPEQSLVPCPRSLVQRSRLKHPPGLSHRVLS